MKNTRRDFLKHFSAAATVIAGGLHSVRAAGASDLQKAVKLRFIVASDSHYGEKTTAFEQLTDTFIDKVNAYNAVAPSELCVLNGDIIHDIAEMLPVAKKKFERLAMPFYVTQGNHDKVTPEFWEKTWGTPLNHAISHNGHRFVLVTTSNEKGEYLSPDLEWLKDELEGSKSEPSFMFVHIPQWKWTKYAIETPEFFELLKKYDNVKAVFHGHEHEEDDIYMKNGIPFIFDSHIGGSWGTPYRGFRVVEVMEDDSIITYMMNPDVEVGRKII